ncbi:MAG: signal recognition particle protein, partial [Candidatus Lokiarchaeota archaeon]|nr:signal recognition particle protein [Candidatus Lokiarchaeota archaeon]
SDVDYNIVIQVTDNIKKKAFDEKISQSVARKDYIIKLIHDELVDILGGKAAPKRIKQNKINIIMMVGIQGSGKTTTVGKLARYYKNRGFKVGVVCSDTWRPGAYDQLAQLLEPLQVQLSGDPTGKEKNALKLAKKGVKHFINEKVDLIIVDTAGRHKEEKELMDEVKKMERIIKPNETILVLDGTLGQQAKKQAEAFATATHVGSVIITKLDGTAKGGGAISAVSATDAPIKFIGVGEKVDALDEFEPTPFVGSLLGIPDIKGLIDKIKEAELEPDKDMAKRFMKGKFTLEDLYHQLKAIKKMGKFQQIIKMLGGQNIPSEFKDMAEQNLENWEIVLNSMTQYEKENPKVIKRNRITRIAHGSGKQYSEIREMLKQYDQMKKMVKKIGQGGRRRRGGGPGMPPGMGPGGMDFGSLFGNM